VVCTQPGCPPWSEVLHLFDSEKKGFTWHEGYFILHKQFRQHLLQHPTSIESHTFNVHLSRELAACKSRSLALKVRRRPFFVDKGHAFLDTLLRYPVPMKSLRLDLWYYMLFHESEEDRFDFIGHFLDNIANVIELVIGSVIPEKYGDKLGRAKVPRKKLIEDAIISFEDFCTLFVSALCL